MRPLTLPRTLVATVAAAPFLMPTAAMAAAPTERQAERTAIRAADRETNTFGIDYRYVDWVVGCKRMTVSGARRWVCGVHTQGGQCFGSVHVVGTRDRPRARNVRISCGE